MLMLVMITTMTWQARHKLAKSGLQMMLLLSSGFLVIVFTRKAKSSFIWWWSSFWSWLISWAAAGRPLQAAPFWTLKTEVQSQTATSNKKPSTIGLLSLHRILIFLSSDGFAELWCVDVGVWDLFSSPGFSVHQRARDPPLQNCICVVLQWVPMLACKFESESHIDQCKL